MHRRKLALIEAYLGLFVEYLKGCLNQLAVLVGQPHLLFAKDFLQMVQVLVVVVFAAVLAKDRHAESVNCLVLSAQVFKDSQVFFAFVVNLARLHKHTRVQHEVSSFFCTPAATKVLWLLSVRLPH